MSRHACHVISPHVRKRKVSSRQVISSHTSSLVMSRYITSRPLVPRTSYDVTSSHCTSATNQLSLCHVASRRVIPLVSCLVMSSHISHACPVTSRHKIPPQYSRVQERAALPELTCILAGAPYRANRSSALGVLDSLMRWAAYSATYLLSTSGP